MAGQKFSFELENILNDKSKNTLDNLSDEKEWHDKFDNPPTDVKLRDGHFKIYYNYFLLDPR